MAKLAALCIFLVLSGFFATRANATVIYDECSPLETFRAVNGQQVYYVDGTAAFPDNRPPNPQIWNDYWVNNIAGGTKAVQVSTLYNVDNAFGTLTRYCQIITQSQFNKGNYGQQADQWNAFADGFHALALAMGVLLPDVDPGPIFTATASPGTVPELVLGTIVAVTVAVTTGAFWIPALLFTATAMHGFSEWMANQAENIAHDPPDSNYLQIVEYTNTNFTVDFGGPPAAQQFLSELTSKLALAAEALNCERVSLERYQGAQLAHDSQSAALQIERADACQNDFINVSISAGNYLLSLPELLDQIGAPDLTSDLLPGMDSNQLIANFGRSLGGVTPVQVPDLSSAPTTVPEPNSFVVFGSALVIFILLHCRSLVGQRQGRSSTRFLSFLRIRASGSNLTLDARV